MVRRHGESETMERFCDKMQLMNAVGYQGIFEAAGHKLNDIGGVMLWKLNAAFPSVVWQVYDWFLMPNSGYYFMQNACEPVHIQLNLSNKKVTVLNRTYKQMPALTAQATVFSLDSKLLFSENVDLSLGATDVRETSDLEKILKEAGGVKFVVLNLKNKSGEVISHNVYWISPDGDYRSLNEMAETNITVSVPDDSKRKNDPEWTVQITNNTNKIAFFIRPQLMSGGKEILPSFWSESYFTLAPGESTEVTVSCPSVELDGESPVLKVSGWNVSVTEVGLKRN
jgi:hypothetical protein